MSHDTAIAELLHAAARRIDVETDPHRVLDGGRAMVGRRRRPPARRRLAVAGIGIAAVAVWLAVARAAPERETVDIGPAVSVEPAPAVASVAAHVASPPAWFGEGRAGLREGGVRTGHWVATAIGRVAGGVIRDPIVVAVFDGTYAALSNAEAVTMNGTSLRFASSDDWDGWQILATNRTPTVIVQGRVDDRTLLAILEAVETDDADGSLSLRLRALPDGYEELVGPTALGIDVETRRTLASESGGTGINEVSDWTEPLLAAAAAGVDLTAVDLGETVGWAGTAPHSTYGLLRLLVWSPRPGVVFEISTDGTERSVDDLAALAQATSTMDVEEWDRTYR